MRRCIYSSIYGGYDERRKQPEQDGGCDFIYFDDVTVLGLDLPPGVERTPRLLAKYWKTHPPKGYDMTVWIDGSAQIKSPEFLNFLESYMNGYRICAFAHPERDCVYKEAAYSVTKPKYAGMPLLEQVASYRAEGYPEENGLFACGMVARKGDTADFDDAWWVENLKWSLQDQLSFPYVSWKKDIYVSELLLSQYRNQYVEFLTDEHKSEL